jgi:hypothetical protein
MHNPVVEGGVKMPDMETAEVADILRSYGIAEEIVAPVVNCIHADEKRWVDFMMRFEPGLEEPDPKQARNRIVTIAHSSNNLASISEDRPGERNRCVLFHLGFVAPDEEHVALLVESGRFGLFRRKDDLLAEGVAAVFGITGGVAELLALCFHGERFTPADAGTWLVERGFTPLLFIPITGTNRRPCLDAPIPAQVGRAVSGNST